MMRIPALIPTRFLLLLAHFTIVCTVIWSRKENVLAALPLYYTQTEYDAKDTEFLIALSIAIALFGIELIGFISGYTMFMPTTTIISIVAHMSGTVSMSYFVFEVWPCDLYWWIFTFCSIVPAVVDLATLFGIVILRRGV